MSLTLTLLLILIMFFGEFDLSKGKHAIVTCLSTVTVAVLIVLSEARS
jgi:hypothetical protein